MSQRQIAVRGIIYKNGKIYAQKLKHKDGESSFWSMPGGRIEDGESIINCLEREMIEETGIKPQIGNLVLVQQFQDGNHEKMEFFFHIKNAEDYEKVDLTNTSHGMSEVSKHEFIDPKTESLKPDILQTIDIEQCINNTEPTIVISYL
jgi:8-oxo-dGTP diphosphatase